MKITLENIVVIYYNYNQGHRVENYIFAFFSCLAGKNMILSIRRGGLSTTSGISSDALRKNIGNGSSGW